jgi:mono/diheme cytochrome c family protein/cbb3-type cytochrome oxidase cytochrome c subunit
MERPDYSKAMLAGLAGGDDALETKYKAFRDALKAREAKGEKNNGGFTSSALPDSLMKLDKNTLTAGRISQFAAHPRLDLFVGPDSPHPADKFGCTICHGGQGSATDFVNATHTPNTVRQREEWARSTFEGGHGWEHIHFWDFPMLPARFKESSCLKCHHQVTDLIRYGSKEEAPKLLEGYNLIRENGCFGCHEIAGVKNGRWVGPDMRLEPGIPLSHMSPDKREELLANKNDPPGTMRKVGPSLYRLNEKTHKEWLAQWIREPRGFRESTRMPHFYEVSNNTHEALLHSNPEQADFPNAEIQAIVSYLTHESGEYLKNQDRDAYRRGYLARLEQLKTLAELHKQPELYEMMGDQLALVTLRARGMASLSTEERKTLADLEAKLSKDGQKSIKDILNSLGHDRMSEAQKKEFLEIIERLRNVPTLELRDPARAFNVVPQGQEKADVKLPDLIDHNGIAIPLPPAEKDNTAAINRGAKLFTERGCLACHQFNGSAGKEGQPKKRADGTDLGVVQSDAHFGPVLSRLARKLGTSKDDPESARRWLVQWLLNPNLHFPRTRMPVTFLNEKIEGNLPANDIALYLLDKSDKWKGEKIAEPDSDTLKRLTAVYLGRVTSHRNVNNVLHIDGAGDDKSAAEWLKRVKADSDEAILAGLDSPEMQRMIRDPSLKDKIDQIVLANAANPENRMRYIGRKAITRLGCYGCHNMPGFELAKPIGTPLNDWGKKDAERLAFEDASAFVNGHFNVVETTFPALEGKLRDILFSQYTTEADRGNADNITNRELSFVPDIQERVGKLLDIAKAAKRQEGHSMKPGEGLTNAQQHQITEVETLLAELKKGDLKKPPFEKFFAEALDHHNREGFLHLKLAEPRSYDYNRQRAWDDRLRMPQFRFAHTRPEPEEPEPSFGLRRDAAEAQAREAVMTFVLGLVAEPIPPKYVHTPTGDRAAEVKGRQVLDKFNCAGCHIVRAGVVEFKLNDETREALNKEAKRMQDDDSRKNDFLDKPLMQAHSSWNAPPLLPGDQIRMHGHSNRKSDPLFGLKSKDDRVWIRLSQAMRFSGKAGSTDPKDSRQLLASEIFAIPASQSIDTLAPDYGGAFPAVVNSYFTKMEGPEWSGKAELAQSKLPPSLLHEGERVQPDWLYRFLQNPEPIRPQSWMALRMPLFNMSEADAQALVDYFAAVDRLSNPGIGLTYPYQNTPQRESAFWREQNQDYKGGRTDLQARLKRAKDLEAQADKDLKDPAITMDATKKAAAEANKKTAAATVDQLNKESAFIDGLMKGSDKELKDEWEQSGSYSNDAYRLLLTNNNNICSSCHNIGAQRSKAPKGPDLDQAYLRLRPDWTARWIAHPARMVPYESAMPVNFPHGKNMGPTPADPATRLWFDGDAFQQILGVRNTILDYQKQADKPWNRSFKP